MRKLSLVIYLIILTFSHLLAQSPHGESFDMNCESCHTTSDWKIDLTKIEFNHEKTDFPLLGQHNSVSCKSCHHTLVFDKTGSQCNDCHKDIHEGTVGFACENCHEPSYWIVTDITEIHQLSRFPLFGQHNRADCVECHESSSNLRFDPLGVRCFDCHSNDFNSSQNPDHIASGFSTDCEECHNINSSEWSLDGNIAHTFFPLVLGHSIGDCFQCHQTGGFTGLSKNCFNCHENQYNSASSPNHTVLTFPTNCEECHSLNPGWEPAEYSEHDGQYFPIYSGQHNGEWNICADCHTISNNYSVFECITCHEHNQSDMDGEHRGVSGYQYVSLQCFACHPSGSGEGTFNHASSNFPLLGAHNGVDCAQCHSSGYSGTSTECFFCHETNYQSTTNPNHQTLGLETNCELCHTSDPGWKPVKSGFHNQFYELLGAHSSIEDDCSRCHSADYANTPKVCSGCHQTNYDNTNNPNHQSSGFGTDCESCHTESAWTPATFEHDGQYFPIYSGSHNNEWNLCTDCHTTQSNYSLFECVNCHEHNQPDTDNEHTGIAGYSYLSAECFACHPTGTSEGAFNHAVSNFPLTGSHIGLDCQECHSSGYAGTNTECYSCHQQNFQNSTNPNHQTLGLETTCEQCHTTDAGWKPAKFDIHNNYYQLLGAHASISSDCSRCHKDNYNTTPTLCLGCHENDYNNAANPPHQSSGFGTDCESCHTESAWTPATFEHDGQYFPIYSGSHNNEWDLCSDCHNISTNYAIFECITCHDHNKADMDDEHNDVAGYIYSSVECFACHPTGKSEGSFNHASSDFPLTGSHIVSDCQGCHESGYAGTDPECVSCHLQNYQNSTNPNHQNLDLETNCEQCHSTDPGWIPAKFDNHNEFYQLLGAHSAISNDCITCHNNNYNSTPNECSGCHLNDYNNAINPPHQTNGFNTDCESCHSQGEWTPAIFEHDGLYFPIYTGSHNNQWNICSDCHTNQSNYSIFECTTCHDHNQADTDNEHRNVEAYIYLSRECLACHPAGSSEISFNHAVSSFPLTGSHTELDCGECHSKLNTGLNNECVSCHLQNYQKSKNPNHQVLGLETSCEQCHSTFPGWEPASFPVHNNYYILTGAHNSISNDCSDCHNGNYIITPDECAGCHQTDYDNTNNPPHQPNGFNTECQSCHITDPGWTPAKFIEHDGQFFPIYSGSHNNQWNICADCHTNQSNYSVNECTTCHDHNKSDTDNQHIGIDGYIYMSAECLACHPTGTGEGAFNHALSNFPLTGSHIGLDCQECHSNGYAGTNTECYSCHQQNFQNSTNPNHQSLGLETTCEQCHTTEPGWKPASFPVHDNYYVLSGAHFSIANDCSSCHNINYTNTPNECAGCHQTDYDNTNNPPHQPNGFNTECQSCHITDPGWTPAKFIEHDGQFFPIYSGSHNNQWNICADCHTNQSNYSVNECTTCHDHNKSDTDNQHIGIDGYIYMSAECLACHPTGTGEGAFNHALSNFPLTGSHIGLDCQECHSNGYAGTNTECYSCHQQNFQNSTNPNHQALGLETTCEQCHTTEPGWKPASFPVHNNYYVLTGAHNSIANDCGSCHNGNYTNTPTLCFGCHENDYNNAANPPHQSSGFGTDCESCHTESAWTPATFDHDGPYFPIYSGSHNNQWNNCADCHTLSSNYSVFECITCHEHNQTDTDNQHLGITGYIYMSAECLACHPTGTGEGAFNHALSNFPLTGSHIGLDCQECHSNGYAGTNTECYSCHQQNFQNSTNPNHQALGLETTCEQCHTTEPGWKPASFPVHNNYYVLTGAHNSIANDCGSCHNGNYTNTPTLCFGCHENDYNNAANPPHQSSGFGTDCESCHTESAWTPATFDHDGQFFPIYSGKHNNEWSLCSDCHTVQSNFGIFECINCHEHNRTDMDDEHNEVNDYQYLSTACYDCHPSGDSD